MWCEECVNIYWTPFTVVSILIVGRVRVRADLISVGDCYMYYNTGRHVPQCQQLMWSLACLVRHPPSLIPTAAAVRQTLAQ